MYTLEISKLKKEHAVKLVEMFKDRDLQITCLPPLSEEPGVEDVEIENIHEVTITPLIMWILHHIDKSDYYEIIIS